MYYTIITETATGSLSSRQRVIHNVDTGNFEKLLAVIYTGIDMDGSKEKMRLVNFPSKIKNDSKLEGGDSTWAKLIDEDLPC